jgi:hypothetical protein
MKQRYRIFSEQRGSMVVLSALIMLGLMAVAALVLDGGTLYVSKSKLQNAANAAVLSGAQELTNERSAVTAVVQKILKDHNASDSLVASTIVMEDKVSVHLSKEVPLAFARLLGIPTASVETNATAEIKTVGKVMGAVPFGLDDSFPMEYNRKYIIKVKQTEIGSGDFCVLALGGVGVSTYEKNLRNGYPKELKIGDIIDTQSGDFTIRTRSLLQERIDVCPYSPGETDRRDCKRRILIPVYKPYHVGSDGLEQVKITGFAYFYMTDPMTSTDGSITGMFVKRAGSGTAVPDAVNMGAYAIKLTE